MKKLSVLFTAVLMFLAVGVVKAQQKIAHLDYQEILAQMPETKKVTTDLETFTKTKEAELKKLGDAFQADIKKYQDEAPKLTEAQRAAKETEFQKTQQNLQQMATTAQADLLKKRETLLKPVVDKLNAAIAKVAKANLWDYVVDNQALIYHAGIDASPDVKKELGIK
ncbi:MAG: OmpH family outer membrane protein [Bacteroidetes bacterium]|nr:OmpH family outer membrane protein [Bacteroidota bacterium]